MNERPRRNTLVLESLKKNAIVALTFVLPVGMSSKKKIVIYLPTPKAPRVPAIFVFSYLFDSCKSVTRT